MKWAIGSDHAGLGMKAAVKEHLEAKGFDVVDIGAHPEDGSVDYPDVTDDVVEQVLAGHVDMGVLMCGNGVGVSIRANRYPGVRAALVYNDYGAGHAKEHGESNVLCFGERTMAIEDVLRWLDIYLSKQTAELEERHKRRIAKLDAPLRQASPST